MQANWQRRLQIGIGIEETEGKFFPRDSWRDLTSDELALLVSTSSAPLSDEDLDASFSLFQLPAHLRSAWWTVLEQGAGALGDVPLPGFDQFVNQVAAFLSFKGLPFPENARCDVVVNNSGRTVDSLGSEMTRAGGLRTSLAPWHSWDFDKKDNVPRLWGVINLGDEETSIVLMNQPWCQLITELRRQFPEQSLPATCGELTERFLRCISDYPPVRLSLGPWEGYRLPRGGLILDSYRVGKEEPDVLLSVFAFPVSLPKTHSGFD